MTRSFGFVLTACVSLIALAVCATTWAQPGAGRIATMGGPPRAFMPMLYGRLISTPTVQKELNLTEDQQAKIKETTDKAQATARELLAGIQDVSPENRQAKAGEAMQKIQVQEEETKKAIEAALSPKQVERLKGIALQVAVASALAYKDIQQELKLSDDQVAKIKAVIEESKKKARELISGGADPQTLGPKMQELRADAEKQIMAVLTAEQKTSLETMKGENLDIPPEELRRAGGQSRP